MDINILFGNLDAISKVSEVLLLGLTETLRNVTEKQTIGKQLLLLLLLLLFIDICLGLCFLMNARDLKDTYASYCRNLDEALTLLDKVSLFII